MFLKSIWLNAFFIVGFLLILSEEYRNIGTVIIEDNPARSSNHHLYEFEKIIRNINKNYTFCATRMKQNDNNIRSNKDNFELSSIKKLRKRGIGNIKRYIETTLVVDQSFLHYHKINPVEKYLMTICSMVNSHLKDASLQQDLELVIVRTIYLKNNPSEVNLNITNNIQNTQQSFANWAEHINFPENHSQHHDVAVLITRVDFCDKGDPRYCSVAGLSQVGACCERNKSGIVLEDAGLVKTSFYLAHELGHLLGCDHDGEKSAENCSGSINLMYPSTQYSRISGWSECSRESVEVFLDAGLGDCLNNSPNSVLYQQIKELPGVIFDRDNQCQSLHYEQRCQIVGIATKPCIHLICENQDGSCDILNEAVVDGTSCGENMWCVSQECISKNQSITPVNGNWSDWLGWSPCSRTCGAGISTNRRVCVNPAPQNGGKFCQGDRKMAKICNSQLCNMTKNSKTFRQIQCDVAYKELNISGVSVAGINPDDPCGLYCRNEDSNEFVQLKRFASDGTECGRNILMEKKCVWGNCMVFFINPFNVGYH